MALEWKRGRKNWIMIQCRVWIWIKITKNVSHCAQCSGFNRVRAGVDCQFNWVFVENWHFFRKWGVNGMTRGGLTLWAAMVNSISFAFNLAEIWILNWILLQRHLLIKFQNLISVKNKKTLENLQNTATISEISHIYSWFFKPNSIIRWTKQGSSIKCHESHSPTLPHTAPLHSFSVSLSRARTHNT
jgi:hypothetical protein